MNLLGYNCCLRDIGFRAHVECKEVAITSVILVTCIASVAMVTIGGLHIRDYDIAPIYLILYGSLFPLTILSLTCQWRPCQGQSRPCKWLLVTTQAFFVLIRAAFFLSHAIGLASVVKQYSAPSVADKTLFFFTNTSLLLQYAVICPVVILSTMEHCKAKEDNSPTLTFFTGVAAVAGSTGCIILGALSQCDVAPYLSWFLILIGVTNLVVYCGVSLNQSPRVDKFFTVFVPTVVMTYALMAEFILFATYTDRYGCWILYNGLSCGYIFLFLFYLYEFSIKFNFDTRCKSASDMAISMPIATETLTVSPYKVLIYDQSPEIGT